MGLTLPARKNILKTRNILNLIGSQRPEGDSKKAFPKGELPA
jgi:hypothetical protein